MNAPLLIIIDEKNNSTRYYRISRLIDLWRRKEVTEVTNSIIYNTLSEFNPENTGSLHSSVDVTESTLKIDYSTCTKKLTINTTDKKLIIIDQDELTINLLKKPILTLTIKNEQNEQKELITYYYDIKNVTNKYQTFIDSKSKEDIIKKKNFVQLKHIEGFYIQPKTPVKGLDFNEFGGGRGEYKASISIVDMSDLLIKPSWIEAVLYGEKMASKNIEMYTLFYNNTTYYCKALPKTIHELSPENLSFADITGTNYNYDNTLSLYRNVDEMSRIDIDMNEYKNSNTQFFTNKLKALRGAYSGRSDERFIFSTASISEIKAVETSYVKQKVAIALMLIAATAATAITLCSTNIIKSSVR